MIKFVEIFIIRFMKKLFKTIAVIILLFIAGLLIAPFLLKGKVNTILKEVINDTFYAKVDYNDVNLSFFRSFPELSIGINDITITGRGKSEGLEIVNIKEVYASVNLLPFIKSGELCINEVRLETPQINLYSNECEGYSVIDEILKTEDEVTEQQTDTTDSSLRINIEDFIINKGSVVIHSQACDITH